MSFEEYLQAKRIDADQVKAHEPALWAAWQREFASMHPQSFTAQKLYLINPLRRRYRLANVPLPAKPVAAQTPEATVPPQPTAQPVIKPAMKPVVAKPVVKTATPPTSTPTATPPAENAKTPAAKPVIPRPVIKPKPKTE